MSIPVNEHNLRRCGCGRLYDKGYYIDPGKCTLCLKKLKEEFERQQRANHYAMSNIQRGERDG